MPKIDLSNIQESTGSFKRLEPGTYVCKIVDAQLFDDPDKQYIRIEWDIAVGEFADVRITKVCGFDFAAVPV